MTPMRKRHPVRVHYYAWLCAFSAAICPAQPSNSPPLVLTVEANSYTRYPSMEPVTLIDVSLDRPVGIRDAIRDAITHGWDCAKTSSYKVSVVDGKTSRNVPIASLDPGLTICTTNNVRLGAVQLVLRSGITDKDMYQVTLQNLPNSTIIIQSAATKGPSGSTVTLVATPQSAPAETLINKKTRDTGQLNLSFSDTDLFRNLPFDLYVKSTDLFSTDRKDSKSAFLGTIGVQHGLFGSWYSPGHIEVGMQGNQIASNLAGVVNAGVTTLFPWKGSHLVNWVIQVPLPPDLTINAQYTHRINQDPDTTKKPLARNDFSLNPSIAWTSISLPWTCKVFNWLNRDKSKPLAPTTQYVYCAGLEMDLGMWYLPLDLTSRGSQRVEGYGDISILIPLSSLAFGKGVLPYLTSGDYTKSRIRVKYADSVNAANNYVRSKTWTYGIEITK